MLMKSLLTSTKRAVSLLRHGDRRLRMKCRDVNVVALRKERSERQRLVEASDSMMNIVEERQGLGLSMNQVDWGDFRSQSQLHAGFGLQRMFVMMDPVVLMGEELWNTDNKGVNALEYVGRRDRYAAVSVSSAGMGGKTALTSDSNQAELAKTKSRFIPVINPVVVGYSDSLILMRESCLSLPSDQTFDIWRSNDIRVRFLQFNFKPVEMVLRGHAAVIFQHELDHLNGILIDDPVHERLAKELDAIDNGDQK